MLSEQLVGPQLIGIAQVLRLLASQLEHPGFGVIGQLGRLAWPLQIIQGGIQTKLQTLRDAQHHGISVDSILVAYRLVTETLQRIQQDRGPQDFASFLASRTAQTDQTLQVFGCKAQGFSSLRKWHRALLLQRTMPEFSSIVYLLKEQSSSFKVPSQEELDHDFLWRIHKAIPRKGNIGIFNRSHYE